MLIFRIEAIFFSFFCIISFCRDSKYEIIHNQHKNNIATHFIASKQFSCSAPTTLFFFIPFQLFFGYFTVRFAFKIIFTLKLCLIYWEMRRNKNEKSFISLTFVLVMYVCLRSSFLFNFTQENHPNMSTTSMIIITYLFNIYTKFVRKRQHHQ